MVSRIGKNDILKKVSTPYIKTLVNQVFPVEAFSSKVRGLLHLTHEECYFFFVKRFWFLNMLNIIFIYFFL